MKLKAIFKLPALLLLLSLMVAYIPEYTKEQLYSISGTAQGTTFFIQYKADHPSVSKEEVMQLLGQLDSSLSLYKSYSLINQFNNAESGIKADHHLMKVVTRSIQISDQTSGCFDITVKPLLHLWGFHSSKKKKIPSSHQIQQTLRSVGYQKIMVNDAYLSKSVPGLSIDCDGIAQGYSVDMIAALLEQKGIHDYQVELGGEVKANGLSLGNKRWETKIDMLNLEHQPFENVLHLQNESVTTSGSFSKYSKLGGKYFGHIIDPRKGKPIDNGMISATVICEDAMTADALDNAFMILGYKKAMDYVSNKTKMGLYMTYRTPNGSLKDTANAYFLEKISSSAAASPHWQ